MSRTSSPSPPAANTEKADRLSRIWPKGLQIGRLSRMAKACSVYPEREMKRQNSLFSGVCRVKTAEPVVLQLCTEFSTLSTLRRRVLEF